MDGSEPRGRASTYPAQGQRSFMRRCVVAALLVTALLPMGSAPVPAAPAEVENPQARVEKLERKADRLAERYRGTLVHLEDTKRAAKRATSRAQHVQRKLDTARKQVARLAAEKYKSSGVSPTLSVFMSPEPRTVLDRAATIDHLAQLSAGRVEKLRKLTERVPRAKRQAHRSLDEVRQEIERLERNRGKVRRLIERYEAQAAARSSALSQPVSAPANVTSRMARVNAEIVNRFGTGPGVGCYRPDDSGEHPEGRACDYMLSTGGAVPSAPQVERGHDIAEWAQANAERLGIMYIIYRQRIWDVRCGCGWETMEDRGSVTANHVDHVHISVF